MNNINKLNDSLNNELNKLNKLSISLKKTKLDLSTSEYELLYLCLIKICNKSKNDGFAIIYKMRKCINKSKIYKLTTFYNICLLKNNKCILNTYLENNNFKKLNIKTIKSILKYCE